MVIRVEISLDFFPWKFRFAFKNFNFKFRFFIIVKRSDKSWQAEFLRFMFA
jgi:hypothetical protein